LIAEHSDAVEADLARYYGLELADHYRGQLSLRRLRSLIGWLPDDSAVRLIDQAERAAFEQEKQVAEVEQALSIFH
jgi:hypothetical protein